MTRRKGRPVARHLPRDEELIRIAAGVVAESGMTGVRLDDIARQAGIAVASLYHYFESRDDVIRRLFQRIQGLVVIDEPADAGSAPDERLAAMLRARAQLLVDHPEEMGILIRHLVPMEGEMGDWARAVGERNIDALTEVIEDGQRAGTFRDDDPRVLAQLCTGALSGITLWYRPDTGAPATAVIRSAVVFALVGVGVAPARAEVVAE